MMWRSFSHLKFTLCILFSFGVTVPAYCLDFQNPDFEESGSALLPAWTLGFEGPSSEGVLGPIHNNACLGSRCVSVHDSTSTFFHPIEGSFAALIQGGTFPSGDTFISQIGTVPDDARAIRLLAYAASNDISKPLQQLQVVANGFVLPRIGLAPSVPNFTIASLQFDISAFAGQTIELRLAVFNQPNTESNIVVDSVAFSVPEPSTWALQMLGIAFICAVKLRLARRSSLWRTVERG